MSRGFSNIHLKPTYHGSWIDQKILVTLRSVFSSFKDFCMDGWMRWSSQVIGLPKAPSVLIKHFCPFMKGVYVRPSYIFKSPDSANCATIQIRPSPPVPSQGNHLLDGKYPTFSAVSILVFRITAMAMKTRIQTSDEVVDVGGGLLLLAGFLYWFGLIGGPVHHPAGPA